MINRRALLLPLSAAVALVPLAFVEAADSTRSPNAAEQAAALAALKDYGQHYSQRLPDYLSTQTTQQKATTYSVQGDLKAANVLQGDVGLLDHRGIARISLLNGRATSIGDGRNLTQFFGLNEFAGLVEHIFDPQTAAEIRWDKVATRDGHRMFVFSYRVSQAKGYAIPEEKNTVVVAFKGSIYVDPETKAILRLELQANDFPGESNYRALDLKINYKLTRLDNRDFALPSDFEMTMQQLVGFTKIEAQYTDYRRLTNDDAAQFRAAAR